jgi:hypothetical protein
VRRTELWNGNRESPANLLALHDPERSVIRWAWDGVERYRRLYVPAMASTTWADLRWHHLRSPGAVADWVESVRPTGRPQVSEWGREAAPPRHQSGCGAGGVAVGGD